MNNQSQKIALIIFVAVAFGIVSRMFPGFPNFSPIGAICIFAGSLIPKKWLSILVSLGMIFITDALMEISNPGMGFYPGQYLVYISYIFITIYGFSFKSNLNWTKVIQAPIFATAIFFIVSNFGCFLTMSEYSKDLSGLILCYTKALPFINGTLISNIIFIPALFGGYYMVNNKSFGVSVAKV
jgi:hypothetical protein